MIHQSAIVHPTALIGQNIKIGPFCLIGSDVLLGDIVELKSHVIIEGKTTIGNNTVIYQFASIGHAPQDLKYQGESSEIIIDQNNIIREYVTIQPGTKGGGMIIMIGDHSRFMVSLHIAHDCKIGSKVILANYVSLAGHVQVYYYAIIGGLSAVLQYVCIGQHAMIGGMSAIDTDIIPFGLAKTERAVLEGLNLVGIKRRGFDKQETLDSIKAIEELFADHGIFADRVNQISQSYIGIVIVEQIINFIQQDNMCAFCQLRFTQ